jgi:hypothetical protein
MTIICGMDLCCQDINLSQSVGFPQVVLDHRVHKVIKRPSVVLKPHISLADV